MAKVNISSFTSARGVQFADGTCYLRWYYTQGEGVAISFSDGEVWRPDSTTHYREYAGTVASNVVTMPTLEVQPTTDLTNTTKVRAKAVLLDANRSEDTAITLFSDWEIPHALGSTISFSQLETHNSGRRVWRIEDTDTLNRQQIEELIEEANNVGNPATTATLGRVKTRTASGDAANPTVIERGDPLMLTQALRDAANGSYGLPSSSNPFVTRTDPLLAMLGTGDAPLSFSNGSTPSVPEVATYTRYTGNPVLTAGVSGFDAGGVRDGALLYVNGTYYLYYTGNSQTSTPWNPTIGLATSPDGFTWTKQGQVLAAGASGQWDDGGVFSPCVFYEDGVFYMFYSGIADPSFWYTGPIEIGLATSTNGTTFTRASGNPRLIRDQAWEAGQGVYAPSVIKVNGEYVMYYSSATGTGVPPWRIGTATASSLTGTWTKNADNPVMGTTLAATEEPSVLRLPNGATLAFVDQVGSPAGVGVYYTLREDAQSGWAKLRNILDTGIQTWENAVIGSASVCLMPNGQYLIAYNARGVAVPDDNPRSIGVATLSIIQLGVTPFALGIFTPTLAIAGASTGITYSTQFGKFTLVDDEIKYEIRLILTSKGSLTGTLTIKGLPVPPSVAAGRMFYAYGLVTSASYTGDAVLVVNGSASTTDAFLYAVVDGVPTQMTNANVTNSTDLSFVGSYWRD